ncbi:hypothetical protein J8281_11570 [Aquimarina sp. U1-2]|uniref:hypothetical protein n=1 Tax=Aquimarina sp. U1-2 TaxID=2823141 RepID=UPI001AECC016|nr:hypothetical protein [Aquimarina sp. U1-2]MBP2832825.1 hypothetical protein [Aquimarina sp. U1-2]
MNKKILNRVLLVFLVVIWGIVFQKIFKFFGNSSDQEDLAFKIQPIVPPKNNFSKDTFNMSRISRDPFLGKVSFSKRKQVASTKVKVPPTHQRTNRSKSKIASVASWPKISYHGYVKGVKSTSELILVRVNNTFKKLHEGEYWEDLKIQKVYRDSIIVKRNKVYKTIYKSR